MSWTRKIHFFKKTEIFFLYKLCIIDLYLYKDFAAWMNFTWYIVLTLRICQSRLLFFYFFANLIVESFARIHISHSHSSGEIICVKWLIFLWQRNIDHFISCNSSAMGFFCKYIELSSYSYFFLYALLNTLLVFFSATAYL